MSMENKKITVYPNEKTNVIEEHLTFLWKLEKEEPKSGGKIELFFTRDDSISYHTKVVEIEEKFRPKFIPLFACLIPAICSIILVTIFLFIYLSNKDNPDIAKTLIAFFIPSSICLFLTVVLVFLRTKKIQDFIITKNDRLKDAKKEIENVLKDSSI